MSILKKQKAKGSFKNYWLEKSEQRKLDVKLEKIAKLVTNFIKGK